MGSEFQPVAMNKTGLRLLLSRLLTFVALVQGTPPPRRVDFAAREGKPLMPLTFARTRFRNCPSGSSFPIRDQYPPTQDAMKLVVG